MQLRHKLARNVQTRCCQVEWRAQVGFERYDLPWASSCICVSARVDTRSRNERSSACPSALAKYATKEGPERRRAPSAENAASVRSRFATMNALAIPNAPLRAQGRVTWLHLLSRGNIDMEQCMCGAIGSRIDYFPMGWHGLPACETQTRVRNAAAILERTWSA